MKDLRSTRLSVRASLMDVTLPNSGTKRSKPQK
jgi:hypothetical protein